MNLLVLAFESLDDLPQDWESFESVIAYGPSKIEDQEKVQVTRALFSIREKEHLQDRFHACYTKHPDPWGEPRNWIKAIAAMGETLQGPLTCEFWFTHEIPAFHQLLITVLGAQNVAVKEITQLDNIGSKPNYSATWDINAQGLQTDMLTRYEKEKTAILAQHYQKAGEYFRLDMTLEEAKEMLES